MRILLTGASGYLGQHLARDLHRDHELVLFARRRPPEPDDLAGTAAVVQGDVTVLDDCRRAVASVDAILHLAAIPVASTDTFRVNALGTYCILEAAREAAVKRVVMASSNCTLGHLFRTSSKPFEVHYLPFDENHPSQVEDNYGLSKLVGELTLRQYAEAFDIDAIALRPAWCWGEAERAGRVTQPFEAAKGKRGFWAYIDMRDAAQAFRLALEAPPSQVPWRGAYFISAADTYADGTSKTMLERHHPEFAHLGASLAGHESFFSWEGARRAIGYTPRHSWRRKAQLLVGNGAST
jgi:UDP-glucose 4-epimerase